MLIPKIGNRTRIMFAVLALLIGAGISAGADAPETQTLTKDEAAVLLRRDWLFQADNAPTVSRSRQEIQWTREIAARLAKRSDAPDLAAELKQLDQLERRLTEDVAKVTKESEKKNDQAKTEVSLPKNLIARWTFDKLDGRQFTDAAGNHRAGTLHGRGDVIAGVYGGALALDGGGYVATDPKLGALAKGNYTACAWVRTTSSVMDVLGNGTAAGHILIVINQGPVRAHHWTDAADGNVHEGKTTVNDGRWHHVAQVVDDESISVYVDGRLDVTAKLQGVKTGSADPLYLGTRTPASSQYRYRGAMDEVCLFDRPLTPTELKKLHDHGRAIVGDQIVVEAVGVNAELYLAVREVKRRIMFRDPLIDFSQVVFVDVPCYDALNHESMHRVFPQAQNNVGRLMSLDGLHPGGKLRNLGPGSGMYWRPDVSFDAKKILFCHRPEKDRTFHLYEMDIDGSNLRQITDAKYDDLDPIYMPDGKITFLSNRGNSYARCAVAHPSYVVSRCDADGKNLYILSMGTEPEYTPTLLPDGRVMYTRWEYTDKELFRIQSLWTMNPDGTNVATLWGNQSYWPDMLIEAQPIPGSRRIIFSGQGHHDIVHGSIGMIDPKEGFNYPDGLTRVTADRPWAEVGNGPSDKVEKPDYHASGRFDGYRCPVPLSEEVFLVSAKLPHAADRRRVGGAQTTRGRFVLYLMDVWGNRELIHRGMHDVLYAMPVRERPVPRVIRDQTVWPGSRGHGNEALPGVLYSNDVFEGLPDELRGIAKHVRVIHQDYTTFTFGLKCQMPDHKGVRSQRGDQHAGPPLTIASNDSIKRILGTVPIEADGSFAVEVPPSIAIHFQLLDEQYRAVHMMRSFTGVMPGEKRGCVGCHESQGTVPAGANSIAMKKDPVRPTPPPWGSRYHLGYRQDIQPILDKYCAKCHQGDGKGRKKLDMTFRPSADGGSYTEPYLTLVLGPKRSISRFARTQCGGGVAGSLLPMASGFTPAHDVTHPPMTAMSYNSKLVANATSGKHHDVKVDPVSARKLIAWVDLLCPYWNEDDIRSTPDPDPSDPYFANSGYPPRTPGIKPFADSPYPPRMKNAPIVHRAYCQDEFPTQADRLK